ncbi:MAG: c-type cytochrome [Nitrospiraceae bacterium]
MKPSSFDERTWTFFIIGFVLLVTGLSFLWRQPSLSRTPGSPSPQLSSAMVPLATGEEPIAQLFSQAGCIVCHTIPGIAGAQGRVGPALLLGSTGSTRLADPAYRGEAKTLREYIVESILAPGVYVVSGYPDRVMPQWYGQKLSAGALNKIADYLERVTEDGAPLRSEAN